ncbi:MAG: DUF1398 domain-containing protein [Hyphomicrobiaceae bacterium]
MNDLQAAAARASLKGAYSDTMDFPMIVGMLAEVGFEGYAIDYRRNMAIYYLPSGQSIELPLPADDQSVSSGFDAKAVRDAISQAQSGAADYTYKGFCRNVMAAGCAGYIVSFPGRRVVYYGRSGETHIEPFPTAD